MKETINSKLNIEGQSIQLGSSHITVKEKPKFDRIAYMLENMDSNLAYKFYLDQSKIKDENKEILESFKNRYKKYREDWANIADHQYLQEKKFDNALDEINNPLCVDIEIASICDLGCPHCFREHIMTPDKIMSEKLFYKIIDSIKDLDVPSIKLNWRGEPMLHPKIFDFIEYAKKNKILDIIINTNATQLNEKNSEKIIKSGLDQIIFSFDGGSKSTYEKMRPSRFKQNSFDAVYNNIKKFNEIKKKLNSPFPTSKIQMVLTEDTRAEISNFYELFNDYVDDVTVIQYNERGGEISSLKDKLQNKISDYINQYNLNQNTPYMVTADNEIFISKSRKPCAQLFQRLMITYDGKVGMCCHDWGAQHCIGYLDKKAFNEEKEIEKIKNSIEKNKKGFELMREARKPKSFNSPEKKVSEVKDIWRGEELNKIRDHHKEDKVNQIDVCKKCTFKDTYNWEKL